MKKTVKIAGICLIILLVLWLSHLFFQIQPGFIREAILSLGVFAPIVYIILYALRPLILFPASVLSIAGGLAFGPVWGTIYTLIGASASGMTAFFLSRRFGTKVVKLDSQREKFRQQMENNGFLYVLILRLIPIFNFDLISYLAGLTSIRWIPFLLATAVGILPGTFAYNFLGSSFASANKWILAIAILVFGLLTIIPFLLRKKVKSWLFTGQKGGNRKNA